MNKIISTIKVLILSGILLTASSCEDFMSTDSNRYMSEEDNLLNSPNDSVVFGNGYIKQSTEKLTDKYSANGRTESRSARHNRQNSIRSS